ncbi:MAG: hypothetical protein JWO09_1244 [Bacteroidetes bacterium]|nr:hypothetical protein [Bacteroidota bacterium]
MSNEKRIDEVMSSLDGIRQAEPNPFLYTRIMNKVEAAKGEYTPARIVWLAAASFALLVLLNLTAIRGITKKESAGNSDFKSVASSYNLMNDNFINYN